MDLFQKKAPRVATPLGKAPTAATPQEETQTEVKKDVNDDIQKALGRVKVSHGSQEMEVDVAGKTIAYVRENLGTILNVTIDAKAWIDGKVVDDENTILLANSSLEFIKASGVKGILS